MFEVKEAILREAERRVDRARDVLAAAQEFHDEGRITVGSLTKIVNAACEGYPYQAQDILERALAAQMAEEDASIEALAILPTDHAHSLPLLHLLN